MITMEELAMYVVPFMYDRGYRNLDLLAATVGWEYDQINDAVVPPNSPLFLCDAKERKIGQIDLRRVSEHYSTAMVVSSDVRYTFRYGFYMDEMGILQMRECFIREV